MAHPQTNLRLSPAEVALLDAISTESRQDRSATVADALVNLAEIKLTGMRDARDDEAAPAEIRANARERYARLLAALQAVWQEPR